MKSSFISRKCWQLTGPDVGDGVTAYQRNMVGQSVLRMNILIWFLIKANYTRHYHTFDNNLFRCKDV